MSYNNEFKYYYWGHCLTRFKLDDTLCKELLKRGNLLKEDARPDLAGHIQKELRYTTDDIEWFLPKFMPVLSDYTGFMKKYYNKDVNVGFTLKDLWINYMKNGEFNPIHVHSQDLSFVIYLQVPEKLKIENKNYKGTDSAGPGGIKFLNGMNNNVFDITEVPVFPEENDCYIFPASLHHMVHPFKSDCERVSVSGNIEFIGR